MVATLVNHAAPATSPALNAIWQIVRERGLKNGDQLPSIRVLADRLVLKPTAIRDALLKAEAMGLVKVLPRAGAFLRADVLAPVASPAATAESLPGTILGTLLNGDHNLFHLLDARRLIEIELVGRVAERRTLEDLLPVRRLLESMLRLPAEAARSEYVHEDIRFHLEIARLSGNLVLSAVQQTLMEMLRPHLNQVPRDLKRRSKTDCSHVAIYEALVAGDAEKARVEMSSHLSLAYDAMLRSLQELPPVPGKKGRPEKSR